VYKKFGLDNLQFIKRQDVDVAAQSEEGPRATPMRDILKDPNASDEQKFRVWRDAMPDALSDNEVLALMQKASQRMGEFKPATKKAKIKEFIQRVRPMLKEASVEKKVQVLKLIKEAISEDGRRKDQRYTVYSFEIKKAFLTTGDLDQAEQEAIEWAMHDDIRVGIIDNRSGNYFFEIDGYNGAMEQLESYEDDLSEAEKPFDLENRNTLDYGMRKTMIHRLAKATDYEISALSLASDEELTDLYNQVFPDQDVNEDYLDEK
jgi:hypothetical protein